MKPDHSSLPNMASVESENQVLRCLKGRHRSSAVIRTASCIAISPELPSTAELRVACLGRMHDLSVTAKRWGYC